MANPRLSELTHRWHARRAAIAMVDGHKYVQRWRFMENPLIYLLYPKYSPLSALQRPVIGKSEDREMRVVGNVTPEFRRGYDDVFWDVDRGKGRSHLGWHTDPHGEVFVNGDGLVWGVVYQLSSRKGRLRFAAGYQYGGTDMPPLIDITAVFHGEGWHANARDAPEDDNACMAAARFADDLARHAAEREREYQQETEE